MRRRIEVIFKGPVLRRLRSDAAGSDQQAAAAAAPHPVTLSQRMRQGFGRSGMAALVLSVLAPLALLSESHIKDAIDSIFSGCLMVVAVKAGAGPDKVEVRGSMSGKTPEYINLTFRARRGKINSLAFANGVLVSPATPYTSLVLHPLAGQTCPGGLCRTPLAPMEILEPTEQMSIRLPYPSANFDYVFTATLSEAPGESAPSERLIVYSIADITRDATCRVEGPNGFNVLVRLNRVERFIAYALIFLMASSLILGFKRWGEKSP